MRFTTSAFLGLAFILFGDPSWAQTEEEAWSYFFFEEVLQRSCDDPTLRSAIALPQPKLILEATDDGKTRVKARVGVEFDKKLVFNLEVASPRNPSGQTTLASLDGLSDGSTADLALSWFLWNPEIYKGVPAKVLEDNPEPETADRKWHIQDFANPVTSRPSATAAFGPKRSKEAVGKYREWMRDHDAMVPVFTLKAHADQKGFDFFVPSAGPPSGLKKTSESHTNYQITSSAGAYLWGSVYSSLSYSRGTGFKNGATKDFCVASSLTGVLQCETLVIAPPKQKGAETLEFEARGLAGSFGLGAHITRDLRANVTLVELPVYLLQKLGTSEMELNLGARVQWRSDTKDYAISIFVGPALSTVLRMGPV